MKVWINEEKCTGCGLCVKVCPYGAVEVLDSIAVLNERCNACGACVESCKPGAIQSDIKDVEPVDLSEYSGVWVFAEQNNGTLHKGSLELLGCGYGLAQALNEELCAVLLGDNVKNLVPTLAEYGAEKVYLAQDKKLKTYQTNAYTNTISDIIREHKPSIVLYPATSAGRDLAPRIAQRLQVGLTADCTELAIDEEEKHLLQTRPAFGGNVMATIVSARTRPQMATVRPGVMKVLERDRSPQSTVNSPQTKDNTRETVGAIRESPSRSDPLENVEIIECKVRLDSKDIKTRILKVIKEKHRSVNLQDAKVIVAGGRGIRSKEGIKLLEELASAIGGEVAGSRVIVENGLLPVERQVGQTGQSVSPELYIACGISGAVQHRAGMQNSRIVVAINTDADAPIFSVADYGIVGDLFEIVPAITDAVRKSG
jgi:electron transfer flavoprotein alpha subunit